MLKENICIVLETMNSLEKKADKLSDKASDAYRALNEKLGEKYDQLADETAMQIDGFASCLRLLGLSAWKDSKGEWHIPDDDVENVC